MFLFGPARAALDTTIEVLFVGLPRHAVNARSGVTLDRVERRSQQGGINGVERSEPFLFPCLAASRTRSSACDTLSRSCARRVLCWSAFPLVPVLGSTGSAAVRTTLFVGFPATTTEVGTPQVRASSATTPRLPDAERRCPATGQTRGLPVPVQRASAHAQGLRPRRVGQALALARPRVAFRHLTT